MSDIEVSEEIRRNFHLFWDNFPFPVMLLYKDRTIVDTNAAGQTVGLPQGRRCVDMGEKKHHAGCLANLAMKEQTGKRVVGYIEHMGVVLDSYWVPLAGAEDFYVHFGIDITEYAAERLMPTAEGEGSE
ncbi:hypothetical protein LPW11_04615 [Geomonas sp. RF6]|uniref:hypothetical protein n=1 Tax=Geomonas sp. RF6 TaxID=2897342 RepID=UPI001E65A8D2|nr:hypothetical protein [Geomonas sp. RF6]UFS71483.1 hypothetical protein LPW11_04615 [Geomonas sp. RF6]